ncbi:hypothetical protein FJ987_09820 [Mesorhizobium sp. CU2]|uniref:hypothetical protein n=1 Tax=unclassified Mesorhizobium TaxID=325217 RepID=UPI00112B4AB4|nr:MULTISPECIES: hypothetical protein [unclassified Mesorhizobium]TPN81146.1 hypothetical protein FJ988_19875 [Mesorhizobium sp. CU3]TPO17055.1 hypothetical protein FJ987_09820 [Mesorhizobium sp. CU2]
MHVTKLLFPDMFAVEIDGQAGTVCDVFPDWNVHDRFGIVLDSPLGGVGATHLIQLAIVCFYEIKPQRRSARAIYPEIYAFHLGRGFGTHSPFDFWPARREVILKTEDHREVLDAINDRAITRLAIPNRPRREIVHRRKETEAALETIRSAFVYSPTGRVADPDFAIRGTSPKTEYNPKQVIKPPSAQEVEARAVAAKGLVKEADLDYARWLQVRSADVGAQDRARAASAREAISCDGLVRETYRRIPVDEALLCL